MGQNNGLLFTYNPDKNTRISVVKENKKFYWKVFDEKRNELLTTSEVYIKTELDKNPYMFYYNDKQKYLNTKIKLLINRNKKDLKIIRDDLKNFIYEGTYIIRYYDIHIHQYIWKQIIIPVCENQIKYTINFNIGEEKIFYVYDTKYMLEFQKKPIYLL